MGYLVIPTHLLSYGLIGLGYRVQRPPPQMGRTNLYGTIHRAGPYFVQTLVSSAVPLGTHAGGLDPSSLCVGSCSGIWGLYNGRCYCRLAVKKMAQLTSRCGEQ